MPIKVSKLSAFATSKYMTGLIIVKRVLVAHGVVHMFAVAFLSGKT